MHVYTNVYTCTVCPIMLEKWESTVMEINNNGQVWRATRYSLICSNHFQRLDYIDPPTSVTETCRLKKRCSTISISILDIPNSSDLSETTDFPF